MSWFLSRPGLWRLSGGILAIVLIALFASFARGFRPPPGRPTAITGTAPVSLEAAFPTEKQLRSNAETANIVIVVLDAARVDHTGAYGYPRDTTPNIDRIASDALLFEQHFSQFPHTRSSTASLFTGQYPDTHGIYAFSGDLPAVPTLSTSLRSAGFETGFFSSWFVASPEMGFGEDFDFVSAPRHDTAWTGNGSAQLGGNPVGVRTGQGRRDPGQMLYELSRWLDERGSSRFFAYIHVLPPHSPLDPPEDFARVFARSRPPYLWRGHLPYDEIKHTTEREGSIREWANLYDANYLYADWAVGALARLLRDKGLLDKTVLIVTADHGEAFGEHGYEGHIEGVYDELVHIPCVIRFPGPGAPVGRVRALTETVDVFPTILDLLGLETPETVQGKSLIPLITGATPAVHDFVFAVAPGTPRSYLIRDLNWALILYRGGKLRALYDLVEDPWQTKNVIDDRPEVAERMADAFKQFAQAQRFPPLDYVDPDWKPSSQQVAPGERTPQMSEETRRQLEALGYVR